MPYRVAADVMQHLLPIDAGTSPETLRSHTLLIGEQLGDAAAEKSPAAAAITISLDSTFIRSRDDGERHLEVRVGNVETVAGGRQVFGAVTRAETDITALTQRTLETMGRTDTTEVTAFTDGCPGLRTVLANAVPHCDRTVPVGARVCRARLCQLAVAIGAGLPRSGGDRARHCGRRARKLIT
jgi:hypothetical protein